jgi:hypothetical protein
MPTRAEFAASLKAKYPQYGSIPDDDLVNQVIAKYPQYKSQLVDDKPTAPSALDMLSGRKGFTSGDSTEPDTWMGGFIKGLKREFDATSAPGAQGMAHPETVGDFTSLLLPNMASSGVASGVESPAAEFLGRSKAALKAAATDKVPNRGMVGRTVSFPLRAYQKFEDALPSSNAEAIAKFKGTRGASPTPLPAESPVSPIDPDVVDRNLHPPPTQVGRVAGKAPTVEDSIQSELEGMMGKGEPVQTATTAPPIETAGAGPLKQSGKFGKSGSLGQPGGYTSGNPGRPVDAPVEAGVQGPDAGVLGPEGISGGASPSGPSEAPASPLDAGISSPQLHHGQYERPFTEDIVGASEPTKPKLSTEEVSAMLRRMFGSRDASKMLFGTGGNTLPRQEAAAAIKRLAPGPSQLPLTAEERINEAIHKALLDSLGEQP